MNEEISHLLFEDESMIRDYQAIQRTWFLKFLKRVLNHYPSGKIVMVLDNARIHRAKLIQPFLEENKDRLELMFLPPYSPNLNVIESFWKWLKESVVNNVFYPTVQKIKLNVRKFIQQVNKNPEEVIDRLCIKM